MEDIDKQIDRFEKRLIKNLNQKLTQEKRENLTSKESNYKLVKSN